MHFLILLAILFLAPNSDAKPSDIAICEAYPAVNNQLCCVNTNYLIRFGYFYCQKYVELEAQYAPQTQIVLSKIRSCLVEQLLNDHELTCSNSEERAMQHHLKCYKQAGFCELPKLEKAKIFKVAWRETVHPSFRETMAKVYEECGGLSGVFNLDEISAELQP